MGRPRSRRTLSCGLRGLRPHAGMDRWKGLEAKGLKGLAGEREGEEETGVGRAQCGQREREGQGWGGRPECRCVRPFLVSRSRVSGAGHTRTGSLEKANRQELSQRPIMLAGVLSAVSSAARLIQLHCHLHSFAPVER